MRLYPAVVLLLAGVPLCSAGGVYVAKGEWLKNVPPSEHAKLNPYAGQEEATLAGGRIYAEHCSRCHGRNAEGTKKRPALRSERIQQASDGDLHWILVNGNMRRGMPPWSKLPDQQLWQLITYLKSLHD
jgi:mono/diheme cytochrome c family protein